MNNIDDLVQVFFWTLLLFRVFMLFPRAWRTAIRIFLLFDKNRNIWVDLVARKVLSFLLCCLIFGKFRRSYWVPKKLLSSLKADSIKMKNLQTWPPGEVEPWKVVTSTSGMFLRALRRDLLFLSFLFLTLMDWSVFEHYPKLQRPREIWCLPNSFDFLGNVGDNQEKLRQRPQVA